MFSLIHSVVVMCERARRELGYIPKVDRATGLATTTWWYRAHGYLGLGPFCQRHAPEGQTRGRIIPMPRSVLIAIIGTGVLLRVLSVWPLALDPQDEAINGLSALHILKGNWPIFTYGQAFMGAFGNYLTAPFLLLPSALVGLKIHALLTSLALIPLFTMLAMKTYGREVSRYALALMSLPPPLLFSFAHRHRFDHTSVPMFGAVLLLIALPILEGSPRRTPLRRWIALGLVGGIATWTNFLAAYFLLPIALVAWLRDWRAPLRVGPWVAFAAFFLGSLPLWLYNATHHFQSFRFVGETFSFSTALQQLRDFAMSGFPKLTVGPVLMHFGVVPRASGWPLIVAFWWLAATYGLIRPWTGNDPEREKTRWGEFLLAGVFVVVVVLNVGTGFGKAMSEQDARYLLGLLAVLPLFAGALLQDLSRVHKAILWIGLVAILAFNSVSAIQFLSGRPGSPGWIAPTLRAELNLVSGLLDLGIRHAYREYPKNPQFLSKERVIFSHPYQEDHVPSALEVDSADRVGFVAIAAKQFMDQPMENFEANLRALGATFRTQDVAGTTVLHDLSPFPLLLAPLDPDDWTITTQPSGREGGSAMIDRDIGTRWSTGRLRRDGDTFTVRLARPAILAGMTILPGGHTDVPTGYRIDVSSDGQRWEEVARLPFYIGPTFFSGPHPMIKARRGRLEARWQPRSATALRMTHLGSDQRFFWSVYELFLYTAANETFASPRDVKALVRELDRLNIRFVYADVWLGAALRIVSDERIHAPTANAWDNNYAWPPLGTAVEDRIVPRPDRAIVVELVEASSVRRDLARTAFTWRETTAGGFTVFYNLTARARPKQRIATEGWRLMSSHNPGALRFAVDGNPSTRWTSEMARRADIWVQVDLGEIRHPRRLELQMDLPLAPGALRLTRSIDGRHWNTLDARWAGSVVWWGKGMLRKGDGSLTLSLPGEPARFLRLDLTVSSIADPWVIHEMILFE